MTTSPLSQDNGIPTHKYNLYSSKSTAQSAFSLVLLSHHTHAEVAAKISILFPGASKIKQIEKVAVKAAMTPSLTVVFEMK